MVMGFNTDFRAWHGLLSLSHGSCQYTEVLATETVELVNWHILLVRRI